MSVDQAQLVVHPLVDESGSGWVATRTDAPLVWLSRARTDLFLRAARHGCRVVVVSGADARLTEPMRDTLTTLGGRWLVRTGQSGYDGLSGALVDDLGDPLACSDRPQTPAAEFLRPCPSDELQLVVSWSMRTWVDDRTVLGRSAETFLTGLGLAAPAGWGLCEPVTQPWNTAALTEFVRRAMPEPTRLVVIGADQSAVLVLTAQRTDHGVEEMCTGLVGLGAVDDAAATRRLRAVPGVLAQMCAGTMPLFGLVLARTGPSDLTCWPRLPGAPMPVAMLIGPPGVKELAIDVNAAADRWGALVAGRGKLPALVYPLLGQDGADAGRLPAILAGFDPELLHAVFARSTVGFPGGA